MGLKTEKLGQKIQLDLSVKVTLTEASYWKGLDPLTDFNKEELIEEMKDLLISRLVGTQQVSEEGFSTADIMKFDVTLDNCKLTKLQ